uniref:Uncharacterized protein n=1 Tax=Anguilla anguilla TaxID=7936 RepID=A0A0E9RBF3_ANGAN
MEQLSTKVVQKTSFFGKYSPQRLSHCFVSLGGARGMSCTSTHMKWLQ